jgi:hypothetical protein
MVSVVFSALLLVSLYFFTPSIQTSIRLNVPVTLEAALMATGDDTLAPLAGEQTVTPGEVGALQPTPPLVTVIDTDFVAVV